MDDGTTKDMGGDARVTLSSSDEHCIGVAADLSSSPHFWAVDGAEADSSCTAQRSRQRSRSVRGRTRRRRLSTWCAPSR